MFLFLFALRVRQQTNSYRDGYKYYRPAVASVGGVEDHYLKNADELRNHLSKILNGFNDAKSITNRAKLTNISTIKFKFDASDINLVDRLDCEFSRTYSLKSVFLRTTKNSDGSFNVRHSTSTATKDVVFSFQDGPAMGYNDRVIWYIYRASLRKGDMESFGKIKSFIFDYIKMSASEITQLYNEMRAKISN